MVSTMGGGNEQRRYKRNGVALIVSYLAALLMVATLAAVESIEAPGVDEAATIAASSGR